MSPRRCDATAASAGSRTPLTHSKRSNNDDDTRELFSRAPTPRPPIYVAVVTVLGWLLLLISGLLRDIASYLITKLHTTASSLLSRCCCVAHSHKATVLTEEIALPPLVGGIDDFITRRTYGRVHDCFHIPVAGPPGPRATLLLRAPKSPVSVADPAGPCTASLLRSPKLQSVSSESRSETATKTFLSLSGVVSAVRRFTTCYSLEAELTGRAVACVNLGSYNYLGLVPTVSPAVAFIKPRSGLTSAQSPATDAQMVDRRKSATAATRESSDCEQSDCEQDAVGQRSRRAVMAALEQYGVTACAPSGAYSTAISHKHNHTHVDKPVCLNTNSPDDSGVSQQRTVCVDELGQNVSDGVGATSLHLRLEQLLAKLHGQEAAMLCPSGYSTNLAVLPALLGAYYNNKSRNSSHITDGNCYNSDNHDNSEDEDSCSGALLLYDERCHTSLKAGAAAAGAESRSFAHNNATALEAAVRDAILKGREVKPRSGKEVKPPSSDTPWGSEPFAHEITLANMQLLSRKGLSKQASDCTSNETTSRKTRVVPWRRIIVAVEGLYSMDGALCPLRSLTAIARRYGCHLYLDEAHSAGSVGFNGRGACEAAGVSPASIALVAGSLSKAFGATGGYIAGPARTVAFVRSRCAVTAAGGAALSPPVVAQAVAALEELVGCGNNSNNSNNCNSSSFNSREGRPKSSWDGNTAVTGDCVQVGEINALQSVVEFPGRPSAAAALRLARLRRNTALLRKLLRARGLHVLADRGCPVLAVVLYTPAALAAFARGVQERGVAVVVAGYPGVPILSARARLCVSAAHSETEIRFAAQVMGDVADEIGICFGSTNDHNDDSSSDSESD